MKPLLGLACALVLAFSPAIARADEPQSAAQPTDPAQLEFFEQRIRPVLVAQCYECHSVDAAANNKLKGGLALDTREATLKGGDSGPSVVPGSVEKSLLISALKQESFEMPPKGKLPDAVIADFVKWIESGAADPREGGPTVVKKAIDIEAGRQFWSLQPPKKRTPPVVKNAAWPKGELDRFVLARLEAEGLKPVAAANDHHWLRRATFDLTGLPPTPEEMSAYLADNSAERHRKAIDRLLSSPRYGERWARYWLDVVRYAEDQAHTFGVKPYTNAWRYRDWVIQALNEDMPYDQFVRFQLAGDLMPEDAADPIRRLGGLGLLGLGLNYYKNSDKAQAEADELDDRVDTVTRGLLAFTVSCARCHDHKFDPIPTEDYYSLAGLFNKCNLTEVPLVSKDMVEKYNAGQKRIQEATAKVNEWLQVRARAEGREAGESLAKYLAAGWKLRVLRSAKKEPKLDEFAKAAGLDAYFVDRTAKFLDPNNKKNVKDAPVLNVWFDTEAPKLEGDKPSVKLPESLAKSADEIQANFAAIYADEERFEKEYQEALAQAEKDKKDKGQLKQQTITEEQRRLRRLLIEDQKGPLFVSNDDARKRLSETQIKELARLDEVVAKAKAEAPPEIPRGHMLAGSGSQMNVFLRGDPKKQGDPAPLGFLQVLSHPDEEGAEEQQDEKQQPAAKPYSRLDLANAIADPENPLTARVIVNRVWQHHFGRGLVGTPSNFGKQGDRPTHPELLDWLTVRFIEQGWSLKWLHREIMLSATYGLSSDSDEANDRIDADNRLLWRANRRRLDIEALRDSVLFVSGTLDETLGGPTFNLADAGARRRTVYGKISRHEPTRMLTLFDFPDANVTSAARPQTTVPQQQLFVLNSEFMIQQARKFAQRLEGASADDRQRIEFAFQIAFSRAPTAAEVDLAQAFLAQPSADAKISPMVQFAQALLCSNEFLYVD